MSLTLTASDGIAEARPPVLRWGASLAALAIAAAGVLLPQGAAHAVEGPAPEPHQHRVLENVHTDAVSTFWENDALTLASKADVDGTLGKRFAADDVIFHVADDARATLPTGYEFIGEPGSTMWLTPQTQDPALVWPGFSTEAVPGGVLDDDAISFTLDEVDGPGDVELWLTGTFGGIGSRLWSSDEDHKTFTRSTNVHMHANWAFTAAGTYRFHVTASARVDGEPVADSAVYTFIVGDLPERATTRTSVAASETRVTPGADATLAATVEPADADGFIEFRDGERVLGHEKPVDGTATFTAAALTAGDHSYTAAFVPASTTFTEGSVSDAVVVKAVDESGVEFGVSGVAGSYRPGETMTARAVGATLEEGQQFRWMLRTKGFDSEVIVPQSTESPTYSRTVDATADDTEISVSVYDTATRATLVHSPWVPVEVEHDGAAPVVTVTPGAPSPLLPGDVVEYTVSGRDLGEGESIVWGFPWYAGLYGAPIFAGDFEASYPDDAHTTVRLKTLWNPDAEETYGAPLTAGIMKDGVMIASSPHEKIVVGHRELNVSGHRNLYREGGRVEIDAALYPLREIDEPTYTWTFTKGDRTEVWGTEQQTAAALTGPALTREEHDGGSLRLAVYNHGVLAQQSPSLPINVTDDLDAQILEFGALAGHYHQGDPIALDLTVDPAPIDGDSLAWQWKWPGMDWTSMPGVEDNRYEAIAEQALDGVQIRAVLTYTDESVDPVVSETRTIHVDDHGAAARQATTVTGETSPAEGDEVTLTAEVSPATVLDTFLWERKAADEDDFAPVEGATSRTLVFAAETADDGARFRATPVLPNGSPAYGASEPVTLSVAAAEEPVGEEPGTEQPGTDAPDPAQPGTEQPGSEQPGAEQPGNEQPGTEQPGTDEPGSEEPSTGQPVTEEPGTDVPGTGDPGTEQPGTTRPGTDEPETDQPATESPATGDPEGGAPEATRPGGDAPAGDPAVDEPAPVADAQLIDGARGSVSVPALARPGERITVSAGAAQAGETVRVWLHSTPVLLATVALGADGAATVRIPQDAPTGDHRVVVQALDGSLVGWADIRIAEAAALAATGSALNLPLASGAAALLLLAGIALIATRRARRATTRGE